MEMCRRLAQLAGWTILVRSAVAQISEGETLTPSIPTPTPEESASQSSAVPSASVTLALELESLTGGAAVYSSTQGGFATVSISSSGAGLTLQQVFLMQGTGDRTDSVFASVGPPTATETSNGGAAIETSDASGNESPSGESADNQQLAAGVPGGKFFVSPRQAGDRLLSFQRDDQGDDRVVLSFEGLNYNNPMYFLALWALSSSDKSESLQSGSRVFTVANANLEQLSEDSIYNNDSPARGTGDFDYDISGFADNNNSNAGLNDDTTSTDSGGTDDSDSAGSSSGGGLGAGAIAGIVVGVLALIIIVFAIWFLLIRPRRRRPRPAPLDEPQAYGTTDSLAVAGEKDSIAAAPTASRSGDSPQTRLAPASASYAPLVSPSPLEPLAANGDVQGAAAAAAAPAAAASGGLSGSPVDREATQTPKPASTTASAADRATGTSRAIDALVEPGMTADQIRQLEEEEQELDRVIEQSQGSRLPRRAP